MTFCEQPFGKKKKDYLNVTGKWPKIAAISNQLLDPTGYFLGNICVIYSYPLVERWREEKEKQKEAAVKESCLLPD